MSDLLDTLIPRNTLRNYNIEVGMTADNIYTASNFFSLEPLQKVYETQNEGCDKTCFLSMLSTSD